ncbi:TPA: hypothetical protein QFK82_001168 [Enterococcus faecium]|uniref:DUF1310 family protein n=2 Tax=Enterococcus TaxID=1350 RepID=A0AB74CZI8_ENTFC|nr:MULTISPECIES: hypothetical protein [Enterococcus]EGP4988577.1 hypothetical protein [Enterococcus faecium]EGP5255753.1 hypothetical protein [Enterococcus faecium]EME7081062.1 hypothetical protein [Enterococcus faecium]EME7143511.1 hypothetical protein [Enterococcus faecium]EME8159491.1 hypothetical protein [Enterococcus faecium]
MPKKRRKTIVIILTILTIGIGGKFYMDKREAQRQKDLLAVEKQSVKVLKNTFADIREVKINEAGKNEKTGSYGMHITLITINNETVSFSYTFWKEQNKIGSYSIENRNIQKKGITKEKVKVTYTNKEEELV